MKTRKAVDKILEIIMILFMSVLLTDVLWQVISRYLNRFLVKNFSFQIDTAYYSFTDELAGFLLIWVGLLGAAYATGKKEHLSIDLLSNKLTARGKNILSGIINAMIILFSIGVMIIGGIWLVYTRFYLGQISPGLQLPMGFVYLIVPFSGLLMTYYAFSDFINLLKPTKTL